MPADAVYLDFDRLVFNFNDHAPDIAEIDAAIAKSQSTAGVNAVELVIMPQFHHLLNALVERGFRRVGTTSTNITTWLRWQKRFDVPQLSDEDQRITAMRAGLNDLR